ncbi:hypothetical protein AVEN_34909-1 [Araneus ventricosus]|uniref:Uncharacterized protein n=1 Tax=Araneus ventricosus TaxID=182803 RepID=A0A4Y2V0X6_ARAVE|nr:hypothetical protein AVEN_34909-1 [Araneus ventricosus]
MQKVNEIFGFLSPKQLTTLDNKTLREEAATTLANLYPHDLEKDELAVEIESFKYSVIERYQTRVRFSLASLTSGFEAYSRDIVVLNRGQVGKTTFELPHPTSKPTTT